MKTLKKSLYLLLVLTFMLALTIPAFAEDPTYSITVTNNPTTTGVSINGNTYSAYKLFSVIYDTGKTAYSYTADDSCLSVAYNGKTGSALVDWLSDATRTTAEVRDFADYVYTTYINVANPPTSAAATASGESATIDLTSAGAGYYLVYGTGSASDGAATITASVALTTTDPTVTVTPKLSAPTLTKEIYHNESGTWGVVGDNQIGDTVQYRTTSSVPDTNNYDSYTYVIHDTLTSGLTFDSGSVVVKINDTTALTEGTDFTVTASGQTFTVSFTDVKSLISTYDLDTDDDFYVYYGATLNQGAILYTAGHNDNTAYLEYSNNPYATGEGGSTPTTGNTTPVTVYDWTFTMGVKKVNSKNEALTGAEFALSESSGSDYTAIALIDNKDGTYTVAPSGTAGTVTTISAGNITIKGLDDSTTYYLHETKAPDGYNALTEPVTFAISAAYTEAGNELAAGSPTVSVTMNNETTASTTLSTDIKNLTGAELPSTGGIGNTIFYIIGGTLAAGAGIMLIARKRVKDEH
ncbi:MAG: SpaH/EbpB family LPXTG-anchored major pilin [Pseudoflavonifractor sp.]|nr:SpaH/EbpB family LPXTG-anchored major pilin [Pseudoflavonifractor sp.]